MSSTYLSSRLSSTRSILVRLLTTCYLLLATYYLLLEGELVHWRSTSCYLLLEGELVHWRSTSCSLTCGTARELDQLPLEVQTAVSELNDLLVKEAGLCKSQSAVGRCDLRVCERGVPSLDESSKQ